MKTLLIHRQLSSFRQMTSVTFKPVVAVDVDEVLAQFTAKLADFHNDTYGGTSLTVDSFVSYEFHKVWGGSVQETDAKVQQPTAIACASC